MEFSEGTGVDDDGGSTESAGRNQVRETLASFVLVVGCRHRTPRCDCSSTSLDGQTPEEAYNGFVVTLGPGQAPDPEEEALAA